MRRPRYYEPIPDQNAIEEPAQVSEKEENGISSQDSDGSISALDFDKIRDFSIKVPSQDQGGLGLEGDLNDLSNDPSSRLDKNINQSEDEKVKDSS